MSKQPNNTLAVNEFEKIGPRERYSFSSYSIASMMMYALVGSVLTFFYTDVMQVSITLVGSIIAISRVFDGISDLIMGVLIEKTHSKLGKARCWILWMAVPYALAILLLFCLPAGASTMVKAVYIFVTYNFAQTVCYTAIIMACGTLSQMMTRDRESRSSLSVWRSIFMSAAQLIVVAYTVRWANALGGDQKAYILLAAIYAVIALVALMVVFFGTKERVPRKDDTPETKIPMTTHLIALAKNKYFWLLLANFFVFYLWLSSYGTSLNYYCKYVIGSVKSITPVAYSVHGSAIVCLLCLTPIFRKFGKRNVCILGMAVAVLGSIALLAAPTSITFLTLCAIAWGIGKATLNGSIYAMIADAVEYGDWKCGVRSEGLMQSVTSFGAKIGTAAATLIVSFTMGAFGYDGSLAVQSAAATSVIKYLYIFGGVIPFALLLVIYLLYNLDKIFPKVMAELLEREKKTGK